MSGNNQGAAALKQRVERIGALDGLRALSVLAVIVSHLAVFSSVRLAYDGPFHAQWLFHLSQVGVGLFFVISGFVITRGLIAEHERGDGISIGGFFIRRAFRILPPLALYLAALKFLTVGGALDVPDRDIALAAAFGCNLNALGIHCGNWFVGHLWSLSFEEQFYLVFPFLFAFAIKGGALGRLTALLMLVVLVSWVRGVAGEILWPLRGFLLIGAGVGAAFWEAEIRSVLGRLPLQWLGVALAWPPLVVIGRMSYSLYLWQQLATGPYSGAGYGFYVLALAACFLWCWLLFRYFEQPLIRLGARLSRQWSAPRAVSQPAE